VRFHLTDEQEAMQEAITGAVRTALPAEDLSAVLDAPSDMHAPVWDAIMRLGVAGMLVAEEYGGGGLSVVDAAVVMEALGAVAAPGPFLGQVLAAHALAASDDQGLRQKWLPSVLTGETKATVAFGDGWLPSTWIATEEHGAVTGDLGFVLGGGVADLYVVGLRGGVLALVERENARVEELQCVDRTRRLSRVRFADAPGSPLCGPHAASRLTDIALMLVAADALGGAGTSFRMACQYATVREQFGVPIAQFQAVKHQLAGMAIEVEPARALVWYAAYALDRNFGESARLASHAKAHLADRFTSVARSAIRVHGGIGYTWEYPLQVYYRRSLFDHAYLGEPTVHRERVASLSGW
jgi:alkylation response protein AidB-like acyl-CoA dehydrogenase